MAEDYQYFIVTRSEYSYSTLKPGRICYTSIYKYSALGSSRSLKVFLLGTYNSLDYPVEVDRLQPISHEEAGLLMALPEEDRLVALNQGLASAFRLEVGTEVRVQHNGLTLRGIIRYIGNITKPTKIRDLPGVFYGIELQGSDRGKGDTDGSFKGKRCFSCDKKCGVFAPFNRITAVTPQTSPGPETRESPNLKLKLSVKSRKDPRPGLDLKQPLSFFSDHFQDAPQKEYSPHSKPETTWDSGPKSLSEDPEPMDQDHEYEDPDQLRDPAKGLSKGRSKSAKLGQLSGMLKTDGKDKPKTRLERPGSARRAPVPETSPEIKKENHVKSWSKPEKTRMASSRVGRGLGLRSESESESGSPDMLQTGDQVKFINEDEKTVKGTFIYMTESEGVSMAHILGDSGMSLEVPLLVLRKLEPEAENMYADPKGPPIPEFDESTPESTPESRSESRPESRLESRLESRSESRTELEKPGPMKSWSEVVKPRFQSEAELKAELRTGARTRPETGLESPEGTKPRLRHGSTDALTAGDQVMFIDKMEQVIKGTVVFMEDTDEGPIVHIEEESGISRVSRTCVTKMEPITKTEPKTENLYEDPDSTAPPVKTQEHCSSLGLDSVVEIDLGKGEKGYGTVRWIGFLPEFQHKMAGLELEKPRGVSDGLFRSQRFFTCPEKHAMFVKLSSCRPDSRFCRSSANHRPPYTEDSPNHLKEFTNHSGHRAHPHNNGFTITHQDDSADLEPVPPVAAEDVERLLIGRMRGIQGHHNSCYMDSALFSLFSVSSVLDSLLYKSTSPQDAEVQKILLRDIVNPLRRDGFVHGCHIMNLRKQLQKHGFSHSFTTDEKDPEEFLTVIMQHILNLDPLLKLWSGGKVQDSFCFQIFLDQSHDLVLPSVQQLLEHSFQSNALRLSEVPSCLILQMPRFGKKFKMFDKILPSLELDLTDLLQHGQKQCCLCGDPAQRDCSECFLDPTFGSTGLKLFCDQCSRQVHAHPRRHGHRPTPLDTGHHGDSERFHGNRDKLHLLAVLCIETSHYVSFVKYGPDAAHWLFFDSMADREGEADGFNVPQVSLAPELGQYLTMSLSELANQAPRDMKGVAKRLLCDAYLYIYQSPALHLYT